MVRSFLFLSFNLLNLRLTDAKKSVWVPDGEGGFDEAMIDTVDGDKVNVKVGWEPKTFKSAQVMQVNPPKMASALPDEIFSLILMFCIKIVSFFQGDPPETVFISRPRPRL